MSRAYLAVLDVETGQTLAAFAGLDATSASMFETHQFGMLGVATAGGAYFLKLDSALKITSPDSGAKTGPSVSLRWEGTTADDFTQVFVDGVRYDTGYRSKADLRLGRGQHDIVVMSIDEYGRVSYGPPDIGSPLTITVTPSPWKSLLLVLSLLASVAFVLLLFYARLHRRWRARGRAANP